MIPMTPETALENAVKALYEARHETDPGRAATLVQAADVWTRLHVALVNAPKETEPVPLPGDEDVYEALRRDAAKMGAELRHLIESGNGPKIWDDRCHAEIDRLRAIVSRMVEIPREPEAVTDDERGEAYLRGWQDARALIDKALLPEDSVIHKPSVVDEEIHNGDEGRGE